VRCCGIDRQPGERYDLNRRFRIADDRTHFVLEHGNAVGDREHRDLAGIDADANDEFVQETRGTTDHVDMPEGHGIE
jgi:hypothetical protein